MATQQEIETLAEHVRQLRDELVARQQADWLCCDRCGVQWNRYASPPEVCPCCGKCWQRGLARGERIVDGQVLYSAAWLDGPQLRAVS